MGEGEEEEEGGGDKGIGRPELVLEDLKSGPLPMQRGSLRVPIAFADWYKQITTYIATKQQQQ